MSRGTSGGRPSLLDSRRRLFRGQEDRGGPDLWAESRFASLGAEFEAAIRDLSATVEKRRAESGSDGASVGSWRDSAEERAARKLQRMQALHRAIRADIEEMHARLDTGVGRAELAELAIFLAELDATAQEGKDSHAMLPRARHAISRRIHIEAGTLAMARLQDLLRRHGLSWPDPTRGSALVTAEEAERSRRRRLAEVTEAFLACGFKRTAERMFGIVSAWGSDYPEPGSPLWEESVLEGVAGGIRAKLVWEFVEAARRAGDELLAGIEELVGAELATLQRVLNGGGTSFEQASQALASALRVLDEVLPEIVWQQLRSQLQHAKGDWTS